MSDVVAVLRLARGMVARGWVQGMGVKGNRRCAISALQEAWASHLGLRSVPWGECLRTPTGTERRVYEVAHGTLVRLTGGVPVPVWNDKPDRTQVEVLALFDRAIVEVESGVESEVPPMVWAACAMTVDDVGDVQVSIPALAGV